jgi:uracil-DNA glycosylase family 4
MFSVSGCVLCPRLVAFRKENARKHPDFLNAPVEDFGGMEAELLIVGLAPGLRGANRTGVPFTGDGAGRVLYPSLIKHGFAQGTYREERENGLRLIGTRITNAVHCLPPENKPKGEELRRCRYYLEGLLERMQSLGVVLCLGRVSHESFLRAMGERLVDYPFSHGACHDMGGLKMFDSYHCSRYNISTGRLSVAMFDDVVGMVRSHLGVR